MTEETPVLLAVQDSLLSGADLVEKMRTAAIMGFDAVELRSGELLNGGRLLLREIGRLPLAVSSICTSPQQDPVVQEREVREARLATWRELLHMAAELQARGIIMVPIRRPHRLPDLSPLYTSAELELALLYRVLDGLAPEAERLGVGLWIEPLNFYEAMLVTSIGRAVEICQRFGSPAVRLMADTFHMNIMEPDPLGSLRAAAPYLAHVHLSDSNRQLPGRGHIAFRDVMATLAGIGFAGSMAIEAFPPADLETATAESLRYLRGALAEAGGEY
ncbi:MAG TPA: sugar phosphate isomerase/epimerase family protein [Anaerolineae bacterium]|nr:sugar phosphate isomerase/epimerase family protein [Anaerolineae bacterium]HOQ99253.1 sugar phosphate isomerase/epimerase family protein [Anaerolineae bacterium]